MTPRLGVRLAGALREVHDALRSGKPLAEQLNARTVEVPEPRPFSAGDVQKLRDRVGVSQAVFAKMLGVSRVQVQSWEQGVRQPSGISCRLLEIVARDPDDFRGRYLRTAA